MWDIDEHNDKREDDLDLVLYCENHTSYYFGSDKENIHNLLCHSKDDNEICNVVPSHFDRNSHQPGQMRQGAVIAFSLSRALVAAVSPLFSLDSLQRTSPTHLFHICLM